VRETSKEAILRVLRSLLEDVLLKLKEQGIAPYSLNPENGRLLEYLERRFAHVFRLSGSAPGFCEQLEKKLKDAIRRDPIGFKKLLEKLVLEFSQLEKEALEWKRAEESRRTTEREITLLYYY